MPLWVSTSLAQIVDSPTVAGKTIGRVATVGASGLVGVVSRRLPSEDSAAVE